MSKRTVSTSICTLLAVFLLIAPAATQDGALDTSLAGDGMVSFQPGPIDDQLLGVAIQSDNKIVVVGFSDSNTGIGREFATLRLNEDGTPDPTFSDNGIDIHSVGFGTNYANDVVIQPDGKIVVVGCGVPDGGLNAYLFRYDTVGVLDPGFGLDGIANDFVSGTCAQAVVLQSDGKIVVAGYTGALSQVIYVARFTAAGTLDSTFSGDGRDDQDVGLGRDLAWAVDIQTDGKIVVAGCSVLNTTDSAVVLRYNTNGTLDSTFDSDGIAEVVGSGSCARGMDLQADGKIVIAGNANLLDGPEDEAFVARLLTNGVLDPSFPVAALNAGLGDDIAWDTQVQSDGKIITAGQSLVESSTSFLTFRHNGDGTLDTSWAAPVGFQFTDVDGNDDSAGYAIALDLNQQLVVVGKNDFSGPGMAAARFRNFSIFADGFESGDTISWSSTAPQP